MIHYCFISGLYNRYDPLMFARQGTSLVEAGFKVSYIVCDDKPDEVKNNISILSTGFKSLSRFDRFLHSKKEILRLVNKVNADIYQISDPELIGLVRFFKRKGKIVVFNLREYYPDMLLHKSYIPIFLRKPLSFFYSRMMSRELKKYDAVFTVTDWVLDLLKRKHGIEKSYLLTNFPSVNSCYNLSKEDYLARPNVVCYEGSIYSTSRQENVFKALEAIPNVKYLLAGKIEEGYCRIKDLPYWNKVEFIDGFALTDLPKIFAKSTIANVFRDFGNRPGSLGVIKVFESMEAALPVLFADVEPYCSINDKYHCGLCVNPNDVESIRNAIDYLVNHKEEAYEMGQNGRRAIIEEFNWEKQAASYINIINQILLCKEKPIV